MNSGTDSIPASDNPTPNIGELGEQLVAKWLQTQNWVILHYRWRCRWGEIDLIARHEEREKMGDGEGKSLSPSSVLVFVEVKTRSPRNWDDDGRLAITPRKQAKLWQSAQQFLSQYPDLANLPCRFDVACVRYQRVSQRSSSSCTGMTIPISPIQLGQPVFLQGYRLILQDYIPSAFEGLS